MVVAPAAEVVGGGGGDRGGEEEEEWHDKLSFDVENVRTHQ
jgi:hypothetical protein